MRQMMRSEKIHVAFRRNNVDEPKKKIFVVRKPEIVTDLDISNALESEKRVKLIATENARLELLTGGRISINDLTDTEKLILQMVSRSRWKGVEQPEVTSALKIDARSMLYHTKNLVDSGILMKVPTLKKKGGMSIRLFHFYFYEKDPCESSGDSVEIEGEDSFIEIHRWRQAISDALAKSKNRTLVSKDIPQIIGYPGGLFKTYKNARQWLLLNGYVEKIFVRGESDRPLLCLRLLRPYDAKSVDKHKNTTQNFANIPGNQSEVLFGIWSDYQFLRLIINSAHKGVTSRDLREKMGCMNSKHINSSLERIASAKSLSLRKENEFDGKSKIQRFKSTDLKKTFPPIYTPADSSGRVDDDDKLKEFALSENDKAPPNLIDEKDSITAANRRSLLEKIILEEKVIEFDVNLIKKVSFVINSGHLIDKKTLVRSVAQLEKLGKIRRIKIQFERASGASVTKMLLLSPEISPEGFEFGKILEQLKHRFREKKPFSKPTEEIPEFYMDIERAPRKPKPISTISEGEVDEKTPYDYLSYYGQIRARAKRCMTMFDYIFCYTQESCIRECIIPDIDSVGYFRVGRLFQNLTLDIYLKTIGHSKKSANLSKYLESSEDRCILIKDLPKSVAKDIYSQSGARIKNSMESMIKIFEELGLLREKKLPEYEFLDVSDLKPAYSVLKVVKIRDYSTPGFPIVNEISLTKASDLEDLWKSIQTMFLAQNVLVDELPDCLKGLQNPSVWNSSWGYSTAQKEILGRFLSEMTPLEIFKNTELCKRISVEAELSLTKVRGYLRSLILRSGDQVPKLALRYKHVQDGQAQSGKRLSGLRSRNLIQNTSLDFSETSKYRRNVFESRNSYVRSPRRSWSAEEDEALLLGYVLVYCRLKKIQFSNHMNWVFLCENLLPNIHADRCRRRALNLLANPEKKSLVSYLISSWPSIRKHAIASGDIKTINDDMEELNFDFDSEYKLLKSFASSVDSYELSEMRPQMDSKIVLPSSISKFRKDFETKEYRNHEITKFQPEIHTRRQIMAQKLSSPIFCFDYQKRKPSSHELEEEELVTICLKSLSISPIETYDAAKTAEIFRSFDTNVMENAMNRLVENGIVEKSAPIANQPSIRMTKRAMEKFNSVAEHGLLLDARENDQLLNDIETIKFDPVSRDGFIMATIRRMAFGNIDINFEIAPLDSPKSKSFFRNNRLMDDLLQVTLKSKVQKAKSKAIAYKRKQAEESEYLTTKKHTKASSINSPLLQEKNLLERKYLRLWKNIDGNIVRKRLQWCCDVILSYILRRNFIEEDELLNLLNPMLTELEVRELLKLLLNCGAIAKSTVNVEKKPTVWSCFDGNSFIDGMEPNFETRVFYNTTVDFVSKSVVRT